MTSTVNGCKDATTVRWQSQLKTGALIGLAFILSSACVSNPPTPFESENHARPPRGCLELRERGGMYCYNELQRVLDHVQSRFKFQSDLKKYGKREYWESYEEIPVGSFSGDCDTHAMAVRKELVRLGIKSRLVTAMTEKGNHHLAVEVGGWVLDNRYPWVMSRDELPYTWLKLSDYEPGRPWYTIKSASTLQPVASGRIGAK